jgi:hypothetical protein
MSESLPFPVSTCKKTKEFASKIEAKAVNVNGGTTVKTLSDI